MARMNTHSFERQLMGYVGGDDDTPEWYATCRCGWRGPLRRQVGDPYEDYREHLSLIAPDRPDAAWLVSDEVRATHTSAASNQDSRPEAR